MKSFDDFWKLLSENPIWLEQTTMRFYRKDVKKCAGDAFVYLLADQKKFDEMVKDAAGLRKYLTSWLIKAPDAPVAPTLQQVEEVPTEPVIPPLTGEERMKRLKEWEAMVLNNPPVKVLERISSKQAAEEGGWVPKKKDAYVPIDPSLYYLKEGVAKFSGKKYKGMITFPGFAHYDFGLVSVYSDSKANAEEILKKAQRYSKMKVKKLSGEL
jgi:hypothetical protein